MDFRDVVSYSDLADYLTAEYGNDLVVFDDGAVSIIDSNLIFIDNGPDARVRCPGIGNLDSTMFSEGFAERDEFTGIYRTIDKQEKIGTLEDLIRYSCMFGEVTDFYDELIEKLVESSNRVFLDDGLEQERIYRSNEKYCDERMN